MKKTIIILLAASFLSFPAQAQDSDGLYHQLYGDGLRFYAEGRYDQALENLYRAWALEESELLLKVIIRSHDFMGHCSAAQSQMEFFAELYPRKKPPRLQQCSNPGKLAVECTPYAGEVIIDHQIRVPCGTEIALPAGRHRIQSPQLNEEQFFVVKSGQTTVAQLRFNPEKWGRSRVSQRASGDSVVIQTPDGRYQIWLKSNLRRDPDMDRESPGFEIVEKRPEGPVTRPRFEIPSISP